MERIAAIAERYRSLQLSICRKLEHADGKAVFRACPWHGDIGLGNTMVLSEGDAIEKAAVNFSSVTGPLSCRMRDSLEIKDEGTYAACGISSIIHPYNPYVPIIHMNVRYFAINNGKSWFGGGIDLTPHYVDRQEAEWFHHELKAICDRFDPDWYPEFRLWADRYFYLPHRGEKRGVGGIFFDHRFVGDEAAFFNLFEFTVQLAKAYPDLYTRLLDRNRNRPFSPAEKTWQYLRRGRYAEFNLLYDRGTKFGLESGGRTESVLLSLPPVASWEYQRELLPGTKEADTVNWLKHSGNGCQGHEPPER